MDEPTPPDDVTHLVRRIGRGEESPESLFPLLYTELRRIAAAQLSLERAGHTLQPTALVHEVYLRLVTQRRLDFRDRNHFIAAAVTFMRRILVDAARERAALKRGGDWTRMELEPEVDGAAEQLDLICLDEALRELAAVDPRAARVVELRAFGGLSMSEIEGLLDISRATAARDWGTARAWLLARLGDDLDADDPALREPDPGRVQ